MPPLPPLQPLPQPPLSLRLQRLPPPLPPSLSVSAPTFNVDLTRRHCRCHHLRRHHAAPLPSSPLPLPRLLPLPLPPPRRLLCAPPAASVSPAVACPHHCHCWLPMSLATTAIVVTVAAEMAAATTERLDLSPG